MKKGKNIDQILKEVLEKIKPSEKEMKDVKETLTNYLKIMENNRRSSRINAEIFVGGSFAKKTMIKKDSYDIDIFMRFDKKYKNEILSDLTEKILPKTNVSRIHGSRDYFRIKAGENLFLEVIPVRKVQNPKEAENVTDLSYSHVNYIKKKVKSEKLLDEIMLAKAFCYANGSYGAESYIRGFSGYAIELLVYKYKSFLNFIKAIIKVKGKEVIDIEKRHKRKSSILMDLNEAKLKSPIILIDPTYKQRNVLAALSVETFLVFKKMCSEFLKNPSIKFFQVKILDLEKIKKEAEKRGYKLAVVKIRTEKQEGDIAGSKLLKFYRHLNSEAQEFFEIKAKGFEYNGKKEVRAFFVGKRRSEIIVSGPEIKDKENVRKFRLKHKVVSVKNSRLYAKVRVESTLKQFLENWKEKNQKKMKDMYIMGLNID